MTAPKGKIHKLCIFCGAPNVSKEHFYSDWMSDLLDPSGGHAVASFVSHKIHGLLDAKHRERPAPMYTKKIRAPCELCNSSWMNRIEAAARPLLTPMILGDSTKLNLVEQLAVARWIALKTMVVEHADREIAVTPPADRAKFMETGQIPPYFRIYIAQHSAGSDVGYIRFSATACLDLKKGPSPPLEGMVRNIHQLTFVAGKLMVHVNAARVNHFEIEKRVQMPIVHDFMRLWPVQRFDFHWPEGVILNKEGLDTLSGTLENYCNSPAALHGGEIPEAWLVR